MGTPLKAVGLQKKHLTKTERLNRELAEEQHKMGREQLEPPDWLDDEAKAEFIRIANETAQIDILDNGDKAVLALYADSYSRFAKAVQGEDDKARDAAAKLILQCSQRLGLTATDRLRLVVPKVEEKKENKYLKYLKG